MVVDVGPILGERYQLVRLLGKGAVGDVFEARDLQLGATVALKRFREASADALLRLKREFRQLASVHEHGLVRLYDLVVDESVAFFTMELVDGVAINDYAQGAGLDATIGALGQLGDAVAALHRCGYVHRDLKPANVLVVPSGDVRLLDFGMAGALGGRTAGTLAYMAPEVVLGGEATERSDWYAFGTLMYEVLTGQLPVSGDMATRLLRMKKRRFPRPHELDMRIPSAISELVWRLLDPDPEVRADHEATANVLSSIATPIVADGLPREALRALFGRTDELAWLTIRLSRALAGTTAMALIEGDAGIGKTSLIRSFLGSTEAQTCLILASAARPQESIPMRAIDAVVDQIVDNLRTTMPLERAELLAGVPYSLVRAFPVFGVIDRPRGDELARPDGAEARREAQAALAALIARIALRRPVVLWVDDIQWADDESLSLIEYIATSHPSAHLLILLTGRPAARIPERSAWFSALESITLKPLDDVACRALLTARVSKHSLAAGDPERALAEARGNPFLLEFLARHARSAYGAYDMKTALASALRPLDADARVLFDCVALAQHPMPLACIVRVLAERMFVRQHLSSLSANGLISVDERECVSLYHDSIRALADATLDAETRSSRHGALATALAQSALPIEWQIPHLEGAGRRDAACAASLTAARSASERYAFEIAASYYTKTLALGEFATTARAQLFDELGSNLASSGHGRDAAARYQDAASAYASIGDSQLALVMKQRAAVSLLRSGSISEGRAMLDAALRSMGERLPRSPILTAVIEAIRLGFTSRRAVDHRVSNEQRQRIETLWTTAVSLSMYDPVLANALTLRFVRRVLDAGEPRWMIRALSLEASFLAALGGRYRKKVRKRMAELRERAGAQAGPYEAAWMAATEASTAWLAGQPRECLVWGMRAQETFHRAPETTAHEIALLDAFRIPTMALTGNHTGALAEANEMIALAEQRGDEFAMLPCLHGHISLAYLAAGQVDIAKRCADRALEIGRRGDSPTPAYHQAWSRAVIALYERDDERAYRVLRDAWPRLRRLGMLRIEAVVGDLRYLRGRCALAAGNIRDAEAQISWLRKSTLGFSNAAARLLVLQLEALRGHISKELAAETIAALDTTGLVPDRDALYRWLHREVSHSWDRIYVPIRAHSGS